MLMAANRIGLYFWLIFSDLNKNTKQSSGSFLNYSRIHAHLEPSGFSFLCEEELITRFGR